LPIKLCGRSGCGGVAEVRGYCAKHAAVRRKANRSRNDSFYASAQWRYTRRKQLVDSPLCEECGRLADVVHHRLPLEEGGAPRDPENLASLCRADHSALHRKMAAM
jgi:5-methylcytosine-specific restriction endonuclease McrA